MKYSVKKEHENVHTFVLGNTKFLGDCTQEECAFLWNNGRADWFTKTDDDSVEVLEVLPEANAELTDPAGEVAPVLEVIEPVTTTSHKKK